MIDICSALPRKIKTWDCSLMGFDPIWKTFSYVMGGVGVFLY
jgi:hypothetical protein